MVIKKIFEKNFDDEVHSDFLKFSRGEFKNRYLIEVKKQKDKYSIKSSAEFANFFVQKVLEGVTGKLAVKGKIISTMDLSGEVSFEIKKKGNFQGIRNIEVDTEIEASEIIGLLEKYPRVFFGLSFISGDNVLKIKPKPPKSGKPGSSAEEGPKVDFCSLKTSDSSIVSDIVYPEKLGGFKEMKINHTVKVEEIVYPENIKSLKPEEIRAQSKRKGRLLRTVDIDGVVKTSEVEFVA